MKQKKIHVDQSFTAGAIRRYFRQLLTCLSSGRDNWESMPKADFLFYFNNGIGNLTKNGKSFHPIFDSFIEDLKASGYSVNKVALPGSKANAKQNGFYVFFREYFISKLVLKIVGSRVKWISKKITNPFAKHIQTLRPRAVFVSNAPEDLCIAGKYFDVPVIEVDHSIGLISHNGWGWVQRKMESLPDGVFCYDEVTARTHRALYKQKGAESFCKVIPHPYLKKILPDPYYLIRQDRACDSYSNMIQNRKLVVVSLSWGMAGDNPPELDFLRNLVANGLFPDQLETLISESRDTCFWSFRFHPIHFHKRKEYRRLFKFMTQFCQQHENAEWEIGSSLSYPEIFSKADVHVTFYSMLSYEAAFFGVPTVMIELVFDEWFVDCFRDLEVDGYLHRVDVQSSNILETILSLSGLDSRPLSKEGDASWEAALHEIVNWTRTR